MTTFSDRLYQMGGIPVGLETLQPIQTRWLYNSSTGAIYKDLSKRVSTDRLHSTLTAAEAATTAGQNEIVFVTPNENHELSDTVTWNNNDTHLIGMTLTPIQPHVDLWQAGTTTFNPMVEVSARGCYFANLTFRHGSELSSGVGYATDLTALKVSGRYNYFENVYIMSPLYDEQDVASTYYGVHITGHNNYFKGCRFGGDGGRGEANYNVYIQGGIGNIFEDCIFNVVADSTSPYFVYIDGDIRDMKFSMFKNCTFYAHSGNYDYTPADAFKTRYQANTAATLFDNNCQFYNVDQICDTDNDSWTWIPVAAKDNDADTVKKSLIALRSQGA